MHQPFVFSAAERSDLQRIKALATDARGRDVLVGLSFEETAWYVKQSHMLLARHRADRVRFVELYRKHENALHTSAR